MTGNSGADIFVLREGTTDHADGSNVITDFEVGVDTLRFVLAEGSAGLDPLASAEDVGTGTLISYGPGSTVLLEGVAPGDLDAGDIEIFEVTEDWDLLI